MAKYFLLILLLVTSISKAQYAVTIEAKKNQDNSVDFYYMKTEPGTFTLKISLRNLQNTNYFEKNLFILKDYSGRLFTLKPSIKENGIGYSYQYKYIQGAYQTKEVDTGFVYLLPFENNRQIQILEQSNVSEIFLKQTKPKGWKSYTFRGVKLDSVFAIRKGIVINVVNNFEKDTLSEFTSKQNQITIEHPDGSLCTYKGFKKGSIVVKVGEEVFPHTFLGKLGNDAERQRDYLSCMVYYLSSTGFEQGSTAESTYFTPIFLTQVGAHPLINMEKYIVTLDNDIIKKEMTRREKKEFDKTRN
jgi:hypothetical protein